MQKVNFAEYILYLLRCIKRKDKNMKKLKITIISLLLLLSVSLTGCGKYVSSYSAAALVKSNTSKSASISFLELKGTVVYTLKCKSGDEGRLVYSGNLDGGSMTVYYDCDGEKKELFSLNGKESVSSSLEDLKEGKVYIIIETDGRCENGSLSFKLK